MDDLHTGTVNSATVSGRQPTLAERLDRDRCELLDMFAVEGASGLALARRHAQMMDSLFVMLHDAALTKRRLQRRDPAFVLAAVGGYGRELLGWKSQLSIRFITDAAADKLRPIVATMLGPLLEAGVSVSYQVVTSSNLISAAERDLSSATLLLDFRPLAGDAAVADALRQRAYAHVFSDAQLPRFLARLETEAEARHKRLGDSVYMLEPDVKNGMGGTRDLDVALWAARARWRTNDPDELQRLGVLSTRDAETIRQAADFMWTLRNRVQLRMGRRCDQLTFGAQQTIAQALDYPTQLGAIADASRERLPSASAEAFMADYYRHARNIVRASAQIVEQAKRWGLAATRDVRDLGAGLFETDAGVGLAEPEQLATDPALALRLYAAAVERNMSVLARSRDAIAQMAGTSAAAALHESPEANRLFVQLASDRRRAAFRNGSILGELHEVGLLVAMIPEFAPLVGRVDRGQSHVYTVDIHALAALDRLRALMRGEFAQHHPLASQLASQLSRPEVLCMATLLHDIGKATSSTDHVRRGANVARVILERMGFSLADNAAACQLIRDQLTMYLAALRRDLEDPATLDAFTREGQSLDGLRDLYLLTVVDVSTSSPSSMTKWKADRLDALFHASSAQLQGTATTDARRLASLRAQFKAQWADQSDATLLDEFLDSMPERYLVTNSALEIAAHARVAGCLTNVPVSAALVPSRHADIAELCVVTETSPDAGLCVVTEDQPGLLASITAAIAACGLEIHSAEVHSRFLPNGSVQAVDLFWVRSPEGSTGVAAALPKLETDLERVITGRIAPAELLKRSALEPRNERATRRAVSEIAFNHQASAKHTLIEVLTKDRAGLLFTIAQTLHELGVSIAVAKISTEAGRARDAFYVTEFDNTKLDAGARSRAVRERLLDVLDGPPRA